MELLKNKLFWSKNHHDRDPKKTSDFDWFLTSVCQGCDFSAIDQKLCIYSFVS